MIILGRLIEAHSGQIYFPYRGNKSAPFALLRLLREGLNKSSPRMRDPSKSFRFLDSRFRGNDEMGVVQSFLS